MASTAKKRQEKLCRVFFPCWSFIGDSFPAGASYSLFSLLVLFHGNQTNWPPFFDMTCHHHLKPWQNQFHKLAWAQVSDSGPYDPLVLCLGYLWEECLSQGASSEYLQQAFVWRNRKNYTGIVIKYSCVTCIFFLKRHWPAWHDPNGLTGQ